MKHSELYTKNSIACSKLTTLNYSTSFSMGIRMLHHSLHDPIYAIYGFVRYADEIVDTFFDYQQQELLDEFRIATQEAIARGISSNPILHSFQWVVNKYSINNELIEAFLRSMEMDLSKSGYNREQFELYVYGSAEVVGLMCLKVFCFPDENLYKQLLEPARKLGEAFQKVNFLRDIGSDFYDRGRIYFPGLDMQKPDNDYKQQIEKEIQHDFMLAYEGIRQLPRTSRKGVLLAYKYYLVLFKKIQRYDFQTLLKKRIRISNLRKFLLLVFSGVVHKNFDAK